MSYRKSIDWDFYMAVFLIFAILLLMGCNLAHKSSSKSINRETVKESMDSTGTRKDSGRVVKETSSKTTDFDYERLTQLLARDPVTNHIYPTAVIRETGNMATAENSSKTDSSFQALVMAYLITQMEKDKDDKSNSTNSFSHGFLNMGQLIGLSVLLLIVGYLLSKIKIGLR